MGRHYLPVSPAFRNGQGLKFGQEDRSRCVEWKGWEVSVKWNWCLVAQLCPILCDPVDCSPPGSSVCGNLQARILERVAISFSRRSSRPRDRARVSCTAGGFFAIWATTLPRAEPQHSSFSWLCTESWNLDLTAGAPTAASGCVDNGLPQLEGSPSLYFLIPAPDHYF